MRAGSGRIAPAAACVAAGLCLVAAARAEGSASGPAPRPPAVSLPAPARPSVLPGPAERIRGIVERIDGLRDRSRAPGLRDEERDDLLDRAWAACDEALDDPALRDAALRDEDFLQAYALLLMDDGEEEEALAQLERLRSIAPEDPETHYLTARCLDALGRPGDAAEAYRRALERGVAEPAEARARLGSALAAAGRTAEGLAEADRAVRADPAGYLGHEVRGRILDGLGRTADALRAYLEAVRLERDDADLWALLAESWEREGNRAEALAAWREVLRIDPSDAGASARVRLLGP